MINPGGTNEKFAHANLKHAQLIVHLEQPFGNMKGVMEHASNKETYRYTCGKFYDWKHRMYAMLRSGLSHGNRANFRESEGEQFQVLAEGVGSACPTP